MPALVDLSPRNGCEAAGKATDNNGPGVNGRPSPPFRPILLECRSKPCPCILPKGSGAEKRHAFSSSSWRPATSAIIGTRASMRSIRSLCTRQSPFGTIPAKASGICSSSLKMHLGLGVEAARGGCAGGGEGEVIWVWIRLK